MAAHVASVNENSAIFVVCTSLTCDQSIDTSQAGRACIIEMAFVYLGLMTTTTMMIMMRMRLEMVTSQVCLDSRARCIVMLRTDG